MRYFLSRTDYGTASNSGFIDEKSPFPVNKVEFLGRNPRDRSDLIGQEAIPALINIWIVSSFCQ